MIDFTESYVIPGELLGDSALGAEHAVEGHAGAERGLVLKRGLDVVLAIVLLIACGPILLAAMAAIRLLDGGPALFWQTRIGKHGRSFAFPKLRSMRAGAGHLHETLRLHGDRPGDVTFKMRRDPRVTRLGRVLRTTSIDELPQLWSVIRGDMSLVGPRPPLPSEVARYTAIERRRLEATPGLTGLWQVRGRSQVPFAAQVGLDLEYIETRSLWLDLKLLVLTIPAVVSCRGAW